VHRCRLEEGLGWWCPRERVILLDERLDRRRARCVLAHELGHAVLEHTGCPAAYGDRRWLAGRLEAQADRWSACRLVTLPALADLLAERPAGLDDAAAALDVTPAVLRCRLDRLDPGERCALRTRLSRREDAA
jgi:Zn-dependent peptidase ImmA (M78 family)